MCLSTWVCAVDSRFSGCLFIVIKGRLPCSSTVSEHCDWKQHTVIVAGTLRQVCVFYIGKKKKKRKTASNSRQMSPTQQTSGLRWFNENSVYSKILAGEGIGNAHTRQGHSVP